MFPTVLGKPLTSGLWRSLAILRVKLSIWAALSNHRSVSIHQQRMMNTLDRYLTPSDDLHHAMKLATLRQLLCPALAGTSQPHHQVVTHTPCSAHSAKRLNRK